MVDDHTQRPFRSNEPPAPGAPAKPAVKASSSGSDPLAELARLIGQSDPFSEFGRDGARRVAAPPAPPPLPLEPAPHWDAEPAEIQPAAEAPAPSYDPPGYYQAEPAAPAANFGRQQFGGAPLPGAADMYQAEAPGYPATQTTVPGYEADPYHPSNAHLGPEEDDFYDDVQPSRRRMGVLVIAGIFALAVLGTAGAFGYRALFGSSSTSVPPPVIKADSAPIKIVPAAAKDPQSSKQITDRVNDKGIGEKLVSREEQPVEVTPAAPLAQAPNSSPAAGNGVVGSEPKKVRTIAIHPDQSAAPDTSSASASQPPARVTPTPPAKPAAAAQPQRAVTADAETESAPATRPTTTRAAPPTQQAAAPSSGNAPLSLNPDAPTRPARAAPAQRTAAATPTQLAPAATASSGGGSYAVQVSSQRSEAEAQAAFRALQGKFPGQLGGKQPLIRRADLGAKGIYFRAMVGPFATGGEASEMCSSLKAAGGSCIVQKN